MDLNQASRSAEVAEDVRASLRLAAGGGREFSQRVVALLEKTEEILKHTPEAHIPPEWQVMTSGLRVLASRIACLAIAQGEQGDLASEYARADILLSQLRSLLGSDSHRLPVHMESVRQSVLKAEQWDLEGLCKLLSVIPLPTLYWYDRGLIQPYTDAHEVPKLAPNPMVRVVVFLGQTPVATPQFLKPNILYPLEFRVRGIAWPDDAVRFNLNLSTTCTQSEFSLSQLSMEKPLGTDISEYEGSLSGHILFNFAQSSVTDDLIFAVHGAFETSEGLFEEIPVIGHTELRLRVLAPSRSPTWTDERPIDQHLLDLVTKLIADCPEIAEEMPELLEILQALSRLLATYAQEAIYKGRDDVLEKEFHTQALRDLRFQLGQDVQEHPGQAGGITDIRYKGVIVELKVEKEDGDRDYIASKYTEQVVQYTGVEARQVSVLLVLDLTAKDKPPGDIRNDILLRDVETHGGDDAHKEFPSKALVFVVNGNTKYPSAYS